MVICIHTQFELPEANSTKQHSNYIICVLVFIAMMEGIIKKEFAVIDIFESNYLT